MNEVDSSRTDPPSVLTVERGMRVLRAFRSDRAPLSNVDLVRRTGLPKATVSRLTSTLLHLGYLRHVPGSREFELTAGPLSVGHAFLAASDMLKSAEPFMQSLADRLGVSVALAIGDGLDMLYIGYRASRRVSTLRLDVGSVLPMGTTSIGHAYLYAQPAPEQRRLIASLKRQAGDRGAALESGIQQSFTGLQQTGTCGVLGGFQHNAYGVALPVFIGRDRIVMGLSCGKAEVQPNLAVEHRRIAPVLKEAAMRFEELLAGFEGPP
jgi:DNA-binding IclR family transcriptional regulator